MALRNKYHSGLTRFKKERNIVLPKKILGMITECLNSKALCTRTREIRKGFSMADIVDTAIAAGSFTTLVAAVQAAGLVDTLKSAGPFTVFAPTDAAFAKLPAGTVEGLLQDIPKLTQVLTYHVVPGAVMSTDITGPMNPATVQGGTLKIDPTNGVKVNDATVVTPDIKADNGVIHVIDTVLLPS